MRWPYIDGICSHNGQKRHDSWLLYRNFEVVGPEEHFCIFLLLFYFFFFSCNRPTAKGNLRDFCDVIDKYTWSRVRAVRVASNYCMKSHVCCNKDYSWTSDHQGFIGTGFIWEPNNKKKKETQQCPIHMCVRGPMLISKTQVKTQYRKVLEAENSRLTLGGFLDGFWWILDSGFSARSSIPLSRVKDQPHTLISLCLDLVLRPKLEAAQRSWLATWTNLVFQVYSDRTREVSDPRFVVK